MSFAHLTLPTQHVQATARFIENTLGYARKAGPPNPLADFVWFDIGSGHELHILHVEGFTCSQHEDECGRHLALFFPLEGFTALRKRITANGGTLIEPLRETTFQRFFFREPINGYVFEIIESARLHELLANNA